MVRIAPLALLGLLLAAAGCLDGATPVPATHPDMAVPLVGGESRLALTGCTALAVSATDLGGTGPDDRPPGWPGPALYEAVPNIQVLALACSRVAVGPFERGPLHVLLEWHGDARPPPACQEDSAVATVVLANVLVDDPEVAAYLANESGLPVQTASFGEPAAVSGGHSLAWHTEGQPESSVTVLADADLVPTAMRAVLFWANGTGLGRLDLAWSGTAVRSERPAWGAFQPPLLMARMAGGQFAGTGTWFPSLDGQGNFTAFRDTACEEAVP